MELILKKSCYVETRNTSRIKLKDKLPVKKTSSIEIIKGELKEGASIYNNKNEIGKVLINKNYPFGF